MKGTAKDGFHLRFSKHLAIRIIVLSGFLQISHGSLIINELFRGNNNEQHYVEFLVTSDITLSQLDGIWFGDSRGNTNTVHRERNFNSAEIISNSSYFNSTSDLVKAGTFITVGGSQVATDFVYNPQSTAPNDTDSWNITLQNGTGFSGTGGPSLFNINQAGEVIWVSESRPSLGAGSSDFISAIALDRNPGNLALEVEAIAQGGNDAFQLITTPDFDGRLQRGNSLSNLSGESIDFAGSEANGGSLGEPTPGSIENSNFAYDLRAVPEPSAIIPCAFAAALGLFFAFRLRREPTSA
ncbi:MAG: hypothetical protein AAGF67_12155 [Verrucomicrobiota bacterium]